MREIFIKYNPYKLETYVSIDNVPVKQNSLLNVEECRLQEWVEELPEMLSDECNTNSFKVIFQGTILDYEDLLSVVKEAENRDFQFECEHIPAKEVKDKENAIREIFADIQDGPFEELKQLDIKKAFELANSSEFPVNVIATMSAGKSTLINAILRQKLMPAKQEACTATITEIKDNDNENFRASVYDQAGKLIAVHSELTLSIMESLNGDQTVSKICVDGNIPFVDSKDVSLVLVDTPGPNNSRDPEHRVATYRMLNESSKTLVLYILNATQLAVNDDNDLLEHVANSMSIGGKQSKDRFMFVVNKLDDFRSGEDSVSGAIDKVRNYLEDKGIKNPNIYPASALTALNIRTILDGINVEEGTDDDDVYEVIGKMRKINRNEELHLEKYAPLTPSARGKISEQLTWAEELIKGNIQNSDVRSEGMKQMALIHSGIIPIETAIQLYVQKYAKTAKIKNIVDTFLKKIESRDSFENAKKKLAMNQDKQKEILVQIADLEGKLKDGKEIEKFKRQLDEINYDKEIKKVVRATIGEGQKKLTSIIEDTTGRIKKEEAKNKYQEFMEFVKKLIPSIEVKLEQVITNDIEKNANELLEEYKKRIINISSELNIEDIKIDAFEIIKGEYATLNDYTNIIADAMVEEEERVVVGQHREYKEIFGFRRFLNGLGANFNVDYELIDDYGLVTKEYVDVSKFAMRFFAPIQKQLYDAGDSAEKYSQEQVRLIKKGFKKKFEELDALLETKLQELKLCTGDKESVDKMLAETECNLLWLENIEKRIQEILEI